jgi:DNA-binding NarL/FixJ family response regulator
MPEAKVLVVDDHAIVRRTVCGLISRDSTVEVICESASGEDAVTKAQELQPDLVLLDISLPGISGIEAARQIKKVSPKSRIIFLSQHDSLHMVREGFKAGGCGYVTKGDASHELTKAIQNVLQGITFVSKGIIRQGWAADTSTR